MYRRILVPVDNSDHSNACVDLSVRLARALGAEKDLRAAAEQAGSICVCVDGSPQAFAGLLTATPLR